MRNSKQSGFTLIELMIVVVIIAVLSAIAFPTYQKHVIRSRRVAAAGCLQSIGQFMERYRSSNNFSYSGASLNSAQLGCMADLAPFYTFSVADGATPGLTYSALATPAGAQVRDTECGALGLDQAGTKTVTGTGGDPQACF